MAFTTTQLDAIIAAGAGGIPTTALWQEIKDLLQASYGAVQGSFTLAGPTGYTETFSDIGSVDYDVFYWIEYDSAEIGTTGEIQVEIIDATSFKVYNTGSDTASTFHYRVILR